MNLLDYYTATVGANNVKQHGKEWHGPCPLCGGEPGKSDRFYVTPEDDEHIGDICRENNLIGTWCCRRCGEGGDTLSYLTKVNGLDFKDALAELGITKSKKAISFLHRLPKYQPSQPTFTPRVCNLSTPHWSQAASDLLVEAIEQIWKAPRALQWLANRGISPDAIRRYHIGYLPAECQTIPGRFRPRSLFALPDKTSDSGKVVTKLFIPRGIVIPTFVDGILTNLRIRRHAEDIQGTNFPKYLEIEGSCHAPLLIKSSLPALQATYFVVEAELDAMLINFSNPEAGALALRTNRAKPDNQAHEALSQAKLIAIALDYDEAGKAGVKFWQQTYPHSFRYPPVKGKDPGDDFRLGVNISNWISLANDIAILTSGTALAHGFRTSSPLKTNFEGKGSEAQDCQSTAYQPQQPLQKPQICEKKQNSSTTTIQPQKCLESPLKAPLWHDGPETIPPEENSYWFTLFKKLPVYYDQLPLYKRKHCNSLSSVAERGCWLFLYCEYFSEKQRAFYDGLPLDKKDYCFQIEMLPKSHPGRESIAWLEKEMGKNA